MKTSRRKAPTPEQKAAAQAKRAELIALSRTVKRAMESGEFPDAETLNAAIVDAYRQRTGAADFRTFAGWKEEGFQVKKGEHGFPVWGKPRRATAGDPAPAPEGGGGPAKTFRLFPLAYLFHAQQVEPVDPTRPRPEQERRPRQTPAPAPREETRQGRPELAARLRTLADAMPAEIASKLNPAIATQNPTRRRHAIAESMREDGNRLKLARTLLRAAAACHDGTPAPDWLAYLDSPPAPPLLTITTKAGAIEYARRHGEAVRDAMRRAGQTPSTPDWTARHRAAVGDLIGATYPGFFPTGDALAARVAQMAELASAEPIQILEPSAGIGSLALAALEIINASSKIFTVERVPRLSAVLDIIAEGNPGRIYNLGAGDFLAYEDGDFPEGPTEFDRIVMNPPFEKGQDMQHVQSAYSLLKPGGILVAIMCGNIQYRTDGDFPAFREWLDQIDAETERAPADAFKGTIRPTTVSAVLVKIRKP
jgi:SAM-dependent methyltransferase